VLITRVDYLKSTEDHNFALVDAAMNDMLRPALYQAWLDIQPVVSQQIYAQAGGWSADEIRSAVLGLLRVDRLLKASSLSDEHHLEEWLLTLMSRKDIAA
jgi:DNA polymerase III delta subunit